MSPSLKQEHRELILYILCILMFIYETVYVTLSQFVDVLQDANRNNRDAIMLEQGCVRVNCSN